jgi:HSP20 family protein
MVVRLDVPRTFGMPAEALFNLDVLPARKGFPAVDIIEDEQSTVLVAELPGVRKEDVKITFEAGVVTLSGERKPYEIPQTSRVLMNEIRVRNFSRSIRLSHEVNADAIAAAMENGVLTVTLPKAERAKQRTVSIR